MGNIHEYIKCIKYWCKCMQYCCFSPPCIADIVPEYRVIADYLQ